MDEDAARLWLARQPGVSRETMARLGQLVHLVAEENDTQNLIAASSLDHIWARHIVDSAQLLAHSPPSAQSWVDLGTGAGFPGMVIAILHPGQITLVEQRRLRAEFLTRAVSALDLEDRVRVLQAKVEALPTRSFDVISARAFAPLDRLLVVAEHLSAPHTRWILPKGRKAKSELEAAHASWQGSFHVEPSLTDPEAGIIVAEGVRRAKKGKGAR
jgi:16S rRNA (guanine527-N7)-methyltransferase